MIRGVSKRVSNEISASVQGKGEAPSLLSFTSLLALCIARFWSG